MAANVFSLALWSLFVISNAQIVVYNYRCSKFERQMATEAYANCSRRLDETMPEHLLCEKIENVLTKCAEIMKACLNDEDFRLFKDTRIIIGMNAINSTGNVYAISLYKSCPVVKEFLESGRSVYKPTKFCHKEDLITAEQELNKCMKLTKEKFRKKLQEKPWRKEEYFCGYIEETLNSCPKTMRHCYNKDQFKYVQEQVQNTLQTIVFGIYQSQNGCKHVWKDFGI